MLYVDGMEGVIRHNATIQWLYTLLASKVLWVLLLSAHFAVWLNSCCNPPAPLTLLHRLLSIPSFICNHPLDKNT